jgi:hypothetical protein
MVEIQTVMKNHKTSYWMRENKSSGKRITKKKWFELWEKSWKDDKIEVLPPITYE